MAIYCTCTSLAGALDLEAVETTIRASVPGCVVGRVSVPMPADATDGRLTYWRVKQPTRTEAEPFTPSEVAAMQAAFDAAPPLTPQRLAQQEIDRMPLPMKAATLTLLDQLNIVRVQAGLPAVGPVAFLAQVRAKAGAIS